MFAPTDTAPRIYAGFGRCIYCYESEETSELTKEHIVPFSLGGNSYINRASCLRCAALINQAETHVARAYFGALRIRANIQTRNPKLRPQSLETLLTVDGVEITKQIDVTNRPFLLALPVWGDPGIVATSVISDAADVRWNHYGWLPENLAGAIDMPLASDIQVHSEERLNVELFARVIAKVAYCEAVATFGLFGFRPLATRDIILGKFAATPFFVGSSLIPPPPAAPNVLHEVRIARIRQYPGSGALFGGLELIVASVRLFASHRGPEHGLPRYTVIVGAPRRNRKTSDKSATSATA